MQYNGCKEILMPRFGPHTEETKRKISAGQHTEYAKARRAEAMAKYWDDVHSGNKPMPLRTGRAPKLVEERFWSKVVKSDDPDGCWIFTGSHGSSIKNRHKSYGSVNLRGATEQERFLYVRSGAHVISWTIHFGRVPDGFDVLHKCDNRRCVNPEHLFLGTNQDNMDDMVAKGRSLKGEKSPITAM
jgi:hypothetical protein